MPLREIYTRPWSPEFLRGPRFRAELPALGLPDDRFRAETGVIPSNGYRIPRRRGGHRPLQQGPDRPEDLARRHLVVTRSSPVRGHHLRLLDPQRDGLEELAGGAHPRQPGPARGAP